MSDVSGNSPYNPLDSWGKFMQSIMGPTPLIPTTRNPWLVQDQFNAPWLKIIEQMWQSNTYKKLLSMEPRDVTQSFQELWTDNVLNTFNMWSNYSQFLQNYTRLMTGETMKAWGAEQQVDPVAVPEKGDRRFSGKDWNENIVFDSIKQYYLLAATSILKNASEYRGMDEQAQRKFMFYLNFFLDGISPTNFTFTNPEVIQETVQSGGQNLMAGMQNLLRDIKAGRIKMTDTDAFEPGRNLAITPGKVVYRNRLIELIQYTPTTSTVSAKPLLFIPHWINRYYILDMQPQSSLIKFLVDSGITVFVISWKNPDASMDDVNFEDYLTLGPLTALDVVKDITGSKKVNMAGYCIGGTLLSMTLPYLKAIGDDTVDAATFFVSLQDFTEVGDTRVFIDEPQVTMIEGQMREQGFLDSTQMANMFNMLRDNDLIWSNIVNNYLLGKEPPAFDMLYWNSDGTRMTPQAHSYYLRNTYLENNLIKPGKIVLKGVPIDLSLINQDVYAVGTEQDHIVPWKSAWRITKLIRGKARFILGGSGHIAGVINPPSKGRNYWINENSADTADAWFEGATAKKGSWWTDWIDWLKARSGDEVAPPTVGNEKYPPIIPAPGTYVLEK